jgi:hypothetical protein
MVYTVLTSRVWGEGGQRFNTEEKKIINSKIPASCWHSCVGYAMPHISFPHHRHLLWWHVSTTWVACDRIPTAYMSSVAVFQKVAVWQYYSLILHVTVFLHAKGCDNLERHMWPHSCLLSVTVFLHVTCGCILARNVQQLLIVTCNHIFVSQAVLWIRIRKDPKLFAGSGTWLESYQNLS